MPDTNLAFSKFSGPPYYGSHSIVSCAHRGIHKVLVKVLLSARMANGRVGLMILHFEMCLFKEGNCMAIFFLPSSTDCWVGRIIMGKGKGKS